jgi:hypothetical protein
MKIIVTAEKSNVKYNMYIYIYDISSLVAKRVVYKVQSILTDYVSIKKNHVAANNRRFKTPKQ